MQRAVTLNVRADTIRHRLLSRMPLLKGLETLIFTDAEIKKGVLRFGQISALYLRHLTLGNCILVSKGGTISTRHQCIYMSGASFFHFVHRHKRDLENLIFKRMGQRSLDQKNSKKKFCFFKYQQEWSSTTDIVLFIISSRKSLHLIYASLSVNKHFRKNPKRGQ